MPHKCVKCEKVYDDDLPEMTTGCACGSKVFMFVRKARFEQIKNVIASREGKYDINLPGLFGQEPEQRHEQVLRPSDGKYAIDLEDAFQQ